MAKTNKEKIMLYIDSINKKQGDGSIYTIDSDNAVLNIPRWSTGIDELDEIIGGGIPEGRTVEIYGQESAGKTTLLYHLLSLHDICLDVCAEGTFDHNRAKIFGNRKGQLYVYRGACGEDMMTKVQKMAEMGMPLIGIDSVPSVIPKDDIDRTKSAVAKEKIEERRIAGIARLMEYYVPPLEQTIEHTGTTVIFINQLRDNMNALPFGEKTHTPGGRRLKHSCSLRIQVARREWIEIPNYNPKNSAQKEKIGIIMKCKVTKSKVCNPLGECEIPLLFDRGFVSFDDLPELRKEIMEMKKKQYKEGSKKAKKVEEIDEADEWEGID